MAICPGNQLAVVSFGNTNASLKQLPIISPLTRARKYFSAHKKMRKVGGSLSPSLGEFSYAPLFFPRGCWPRMDRQNAGLFCSFGAEVEVEDSYEAVHFLMLIYLLFLVEFLPGRWERSETTAGIPYYIK